MSTVKSKSKIFHALVDFIDLSSTKTMFCIFVDTTKTQSETKYRNAWQRPAVARQVQRTHPGEDTPLQRSNRRVCC